MASVFPPMYDQLLAIQKTLRVAKETKLDAVMARENFACRVIASAGTDGISTGAVAKRLAVRIEDAKLLLATLKKQERIYDDNEHWFSTGN